VYGTAQLQGNNQSRLRREQNTGKTHPKSGKSASGRSRVRYLLLNMCVNFMYCNLPLTKIDNVYYHSTLFRKSQWMAKTTPCMYHSAGQCNAVGFETKLSYTVRTYDSYVFSCT